MDVTWKRLHLDLQTPWRIAHGASTTRENILVQIGQGIGEAAAVPYLGNSAASIEEYLASVRLPAAASLLELEALLRSLPQGSRPGRAACDMALHDAWAKQVGRPLYELLGAKREIAPTSVTIAIDSPKAMARRARAAPWPILKLKLGGGDGQDEERVKAVREVSSAVLRVDVNAGWTREQAHALLPRLHEYSVELVEQPLPVGDLDGLTTISRLSPRPSLFVDESIMECSDILRHAEAVDGIVVKLAKAGGFQQLLRQIHMAHSIGLRVMLGCMVESSLAVTAAAQVASLADLVDLDGPLLLANDPFEGIIYNQGVIELPDAPGIGIRERIPGSKP